MYIGLVEVLRLQLSSYRSYKRPANATAGVLRKKDKLHGKERRHGTCGVWCWKRIRMFFFGVAFGLSKKMSKRRLDTNAPLGAQYQHLCHEIPKLQGNLARQVLDVLHAGEKETGRGVASRLSNIYPAASPTLRKIPLHADHAEKHLYVASLPHLVQSKVNSCALFRSSLKWALEKTGPHLELVVFWDEAVPGNVLNPDLRRKAGLTYVTFADFPATFLDTCWLTLSLTRTQSLQDIPHGYAKSMTSILKHIQEDTKDGFMIEIDEEPHLFFLRCISILADADGIRLLTGCKGSSGMKCCFQCTNVLGGQRCNVDEHQHISSNQVHLFNRQTREGLRDFFTHLSGLTVKSTREKAETMLGWNTDALRACFLLDPALTSIVSLGDVLYDPMHCYVANGIVNQELGLWWSALVSKSTVHLEDFQRYVLNSWSWNSKTAATVRGLNLLLTPKLWQKNKDFRGDASETLNALPLAVAFSIEVLQPVCPYLEKEIASLCALHSVVLAWLRAKRRPDDTSQASWSAKQVVHIDKFVSCYGQEAARPKLHFSLHLPEQLGRKGRTLDAFPTERKHKRFKTEVAVNVKRLHDFDCVSLLKCVEKDIHSTPGGHTLETQLCEAGRHSHALACAMKAKTALVAQGLTSMAVEYGKGQYTILTPDVAVAIQAAALVDGQPFLLCHELQNTGHSCDNLSHWKQTSDSMACVPLSQVASSVSALYYRTAEKQNTKTVSLLPG